MAKLYENINRDLAAFIEAQKMFFVATAPLSGEGHVNVSPKGMDCFRILSERRVAYLDLTGSGNETSAHITENGRITFMFCAFDHPPSILRLYGTGRTILPGDAEWDDLCPRFPTIAGTRQIIAADISRVQTACGYAVPLMDFVAERETLALYWEKSGEAALHTYQQEKNAVSIDGLAAPRPHPLTPSPSEGRGGTEIREEDTVVLSLPASVPPLPSEGEGVRGWGRPRDESRF